MPPNAPYSELGPEKRFEYVKELYVNDDDFASVFAAREKAAFGKFYRLDG